MSVPRISLIFLSYNRPVMLAAAIASARANRPDEWLLVDDGSDFDPRPYADWDADIIAPPLTLEERLRTPRLGSLINQALDAATGDVIGILCDDDLFAPGWLDAVRAHYARHPATPMVRGHWLAFDADHPPTPDCPNAVADPRGMTTGNFAHRRELKGARWPEHTVSSHDDLFLWNVHAGGTNTFAVPLIGMAGWRRLHEHNALNFTAGHGYTEAARAAFAGRWLE